MFDSGTLGGGSVYLNDARIASGFNTILDSSSAVIIGTPPYKASNEPVGLRFKSAFPPYTTGPPDTVKKMFDSKPQIVALPQGDVTLYAGE